MGDSHHPPLFLLLSDSPTTTLARLSGASGARGIARRLRLGERRARIAAGEAAGGIPLMREGLAACKATGTEQHRASYLVLLADALGAAGQIAEGLEALQEALAAVQRTREHFYEAELFRIRGELILKSEVQSPESGVDNPPSETRQPPSEAEVCFHQAIEIARRQSAKSYELRAVMSLCRLWQQQDKRAEAREMLAAIYGWFTEGFGTADLQEAKALLEELA